MTGRQVTIGTLDAARVGEVLALADAARQADGVAPLSEHVLLHLRYERAGRPGGGGGREAAGAAGAAGGGRDLVLAVDGEVAGYAHLDPPEAAGPGASADLTGELVIRPDRRGQGLGLALARGLTVEAAGRHVRIWAHGDLPAAAGLARAAGFERVRALWQMRRSLRDRPRQPRLPAGVTLRTFVPGRDEQEWLRVNARAFAGHPEQGGWEVEVLLDRERQPWFDPEGFRVHEEDGAVAAWCWTKVHGRATPPMGEIYVIGVDPDYQGRGLGRALARAGLDWLAGQGLEVGMLYVDATNQAAFDLYRSLGFVEDHADRAYRRVVAGRSG